MDKMPNGVEPDFSSANSLVCQRLGLARTWPPIFWLGEMRSSTPHFNSHQRKRPRACEATPKTAIDEVDVNDSWVIFSLIASAVPMHLPCQRQHVELQKSARHRRPSAAQGPAGLAKGSVDSGFDEAAASCRDTRGGCRLPRGSRSDTVCEGVEADAGDGLR